MSLETKTINFKFAVFEAKQKNSQELKHKKNIFGGTKIIFKAINTMILQILFFYQYFFII
jgi:hypothetical protein